MYKGPKKAIKVNCGWILVVWSILQQLIKIHTVPSHLVQKLIPSKSIYFFILFSYLSLSSSYILSPFLKSLSSYLSRSHFFPILTSFSFISSQFWYFTTIIFSYFLYNLSPPLVSSSSSSLKFLPSSSYLCPISTWQPAHELKSSVSQRFIFGSL